MKNKHNRNNLLQHKLFQTRTRLFSKQSINSWPIPMTRCKQDISSISLQTLMRIKNEVLHNEILKSDIQHWWDRLSHYITCNSYKICSLYRVWSPIMFTLQPLANFCDPFLSFSCSYCFCEKHQYLHKSRATISLLAQLGSYILLYGIS